MRSNRVPNQKRLNERQHLLDSVRSDRKIKPVFKHRICDSCGKSPKPRALNELHPSLCSPRGLADNPQDQRVCNGLRSLFIDRQAEFVSQQNKDQCDCGGKKRSAAFGPFNDLVHGGSCQVVPVTSKLLKTPIEKLVPATPVKSKTSTPGHQSHIDRDTWPLVAGFVRFLPLLDLQYRPMVFDQWLG